MGDRGYTSSTFFGGDGSLFKLEFPASTRSTDCSDELLVEERGGRQARPDLQARKLASPARLGAKSF
jgi:hypothetical protein